jgi:hypothetical protein
MKSRSTTTKHKLAASSTTVGRDRFSKISAVEGIVLSQAAKRRAAEFERKGLPPEERIRRIVEVHRKG